MKLKPKIKKLDEVDEPFRALYVQRGDEYVFAGVDGHSVDNVETLERSLREARTFGDQQKDKLRPWERAFGEKKPEEIQEQLDRTEEYRLASEGKLDAGELEKRVEARLATATAPLQRKIEALTEERDTAKTKAAEMETGLKTRTIGEQLLAAGIEAGVDPDACKPGGGLLAIASGFFELSADGKTTVTKADSGFAQGLTPDKVLPQLLEKHPYLRATSSGGGGRGGNRENGITGNPWNADPKAGQWNRTEQMRLAKADPARAAELKKQAGYTGASGMGMEEGSPLG